jgi:uncharacterized NAD-dependent epimerase/dehydratase family protein
VYASEINEGLAILHRVLLHYAQHSYYYDFDAKWEIIEAIERLRAEVPEVLHPLDFISVSLNA